MSKHHRISHCDSEHTMKIEKEKMAEVRKEEEKKWLINLNVMKNLVVNN